MTLEAGDRELKDSLTDTKEVIITKNCFPFTLRENMNNSAGDNYARWRVVNGVNFYKHVARRKGKQLYRLPSFLWEVLE